MADKLITREEIDILVDLVQKDIQHLENWIEYFDKHPGNRTLEKRKNNYSQRRDVLTEINKKLN